MLEQDYISKIKDEKIKKPMLKISNFFEPYIGNDHDDESKILFEKDNIHEYYQRLEKNNIKQEISSLRKEVSQKEYSVLNGVPSAYEEFVSIRNRFKNFAVILYI